MKTVLYMHSGSGNHGCEALARTISALCPKKSQVCLFSKCCAEDAFYIRGPKFSLFETGIIPGRNTLSGFITAFRIKYFKQKFAFIKPAYRSLIAACGPDTVAISIGGDNYCYDGVPEVLAELNFLLNKRGARTVLLGCSIEPELLRDDKIKRDMERYSLITARESVTYSALKEADIQTDIRLIPDSAFLLPTHKASLSEGFQEGNMVGINTSPMVQALQTGDNVLLKNYYNLIEYILDSTDMGIALIPHVVWQDNNDLNVLRPLFEKYRASGRVVLVDDCDAETLKGYIARCRFITAARTHASIAAYSSGVPTMVVGYSVKSIGIARDLFGTDKGYVLPVSRIKDDDEILNAMKWLFENEDKIKTHLRNRLPEYIKPISDITALLEKMGC